MRKLFLLTLVFLLQACVHSYSPTSELRDIKEHRLNGLDESAILEKYGKPTYQLKQAGQKYYIYQRSSKDLGLTKGVHISGGRSTGRFWTITGSDCLQLTIEDTKVSDVEFKYVEIRDSNKTLISCLNKFWDLSNGKNLLTYNEARGQWLPIYFQPNISDMAVLEIESKTYRPVDINLYTNADECSGRMALFSIDGHNNLPFQTRIKANEYFLFSVLILDSVNGQTTSKTPKVKCEIFGKFKPKLGNKYRLQVESLTQREGKWTCTAPTVYKIDDSDVEVKKNIVVTGLASVKPEPELGPFCKEIFTDAK